MALEFRDDDELVIQADLPGLDPDRDICITISRDVLHIRAGVDAPPGGIGDPSDLRFGTFARDIALPGGTEESRIRAWYGDGKLEVRAPIGDGNEPIVVPIPVARRPPPVTAAQP
jgi:HSP20 family protein